MYRTYILRNVSRVGSAGDYVLLYVTMNYDTWYTKQYEQYLLGVRSSTPHFFCLFSVENPRTEL